jgi:large subunit ribosomal protein L6
MSRIGKLPIAIPGGVTVKASGNEIEVKGPKGTLTTKVPEIISVEIGEDVLSFARPDDKRASRSLHGLTRALVANMVEGVTQGFSKTLEIQGVGYRAAMNAGVLNLALGFSHPVNLEIPEGLTVSVDGTTIVKIEGIDKQLVGQFAADVRGIRPPEPYKGKGIRYSGEGIRRKVGKAGVV